VVIEIKNPEPMVKITRSETLRRTKNMLKREWNLVEEPTSDISFCSRPPDGLGKTEYDIRALEHPIETVDFADVNAQVFGHHLAQAESVGALSDKIWAGIPDAYKIKS
jgi:hypothetical protein